jgi:hypothetical protein
MQPVDCFSAARPNDYSPHFKRKSLQGVSALVRFGGKVYWWVVWHSFPFIPTFGSTCNTFPISPTPWHCCLFPLVEFAVEAKALTIWAAQQQHLSAPKFIF